MRNQRRGTLALAVGFAACLTSCRQPQSAPCAGTWVMNVDGKPFMVLTLEPEDGRYAGTLARPQRMTSDGNNFSGISRETTTARVTSEPPRESTLRITAAAPDSPGDAEAFELRLTAADEAQLKIVDAPIEPWPVTRRTGSGTPQVFTAWDARRSYPLEEPYTEPNPEMAAIYAADFLFAHTLALVALSKGDC